MRILLDECVNAGLKKAFPRHMVQTVSGAGWCGILDRPLLTPVLVDFLRCWTRTMLG